MLGTGSHDIGAPSHSRGVRAHHDLLLLGVLRRRCAYRVRFHRKEFLVLPAAWSRVWSGGGEVQGGGVRPGDLSCRQCISGALHSGERLADLGSDLLVLHDLWWHGVVDGLVPYLLARGARCASHDCRQPGCALQHGLWRGPCPQRPSHRQAWRSANAGAGALRDGRGRTPHRHVAGLQHELGGGGDARYGHRHEHQCRLQARST
mmetsp:Transcript_2202/g.5528  ORF Transcript_2202/g.5528 Transcript_2202/m.5528 type:complete len:205 (-) Transcript_2202:772-1386(-)